MAGDIVLAWYCGQAATFDPRASTWSVARRPSSARYVTSLGQVSAGRVYAVMIAHDATSGSVKGLWAYKP
jgi:hypothetical protein